MKQKGNEAFVAQNESANLTYSSSERKFNLKKFKKINIFNKLNITML